MKKMNTLLILLPLLIGITGCEQTERYTAKQISVYGFDAHYMRDVECRFYDDIKALPYIDINTYYNLLLNKEVKITSLSNNKFEVKTYNGSATIDVKNDVLYSDDYNEFINTTIYRSGDSRNSYYDGAPFLKITDYTSPDEVTPKTIDFKKYKIDFKYDEGKIWAPLITFSDMFKGVTMIQSSYNGKSIYLIDSNMDLMTPTFIEDNYKEPILETFYKNGKRDPKLAELSYYELCFVIDNYYGYPGRSPIETMTKEHGFDYALENYSSSTKLVKEYLLSTDINEYFGGLFLLNNVLFDGGHSATYMGVLSLLSQENFSEYGNFDKVMEYSEDPEYIRFPGKRGPSSETYNEARKNMGADETFNSKGDTFVYTFDSFDIDYNGWNDFYSGKTTELPNDTVGNLHKGIALAKQDPNIKNFLIDLSTNGGGYGDVVVYIMKILTNTSTLYFYDHIDKRNIAQNYICDVNLDGKFDELDNVPIADFNFGIITSGISFSCANLLPALAQDNNIPILGDKTGGGACAVLDNYTMEGIYYRLSSFLHLTNEDFDSVDAGVPADYDLINIDETENINNLYDIDLLSQCMNDFYN